MNKLYVLSVSKRKRTTYCQNLQSPEQQKIFKNYMSKKIEIKAGYLFGTRKLVHMV